MAKGDKALRKANRHKELNQKGTRKSVGKSGRGTSYLDAYGASYSQSRKGRKELADWKLGTSFGAASEVRHIDPATYKFDEGN